MRKEMNKGLRLSDCGILRENQECHQDILLQEEEEEVVVVVAAWAVDKDILTMEGAIGIHVSLLAQRCVLPAPMCVGNLSPYSSPFFSAGESPSSTPSHV